MSIKSVIPTHPNKINMERAYLQGKSIASIARDFNVSEESLRHHLQNNLSRQLVKAFEQKELTSSMNLLGEIDQIIAYTKDIFKRNYDKKADVTALKALDSQRSTLELLSRISMYLHQTKLLDLQNSQADSQKEQDEKFSDRLKILTYPELEMLYKIQDKLNRQDKRLIIIPEKPQFVVKSGMTRVLRSNTATK